MRFTESFITLTTLTVATLIGFTVGVVAVPAPVVNVMSDAEFMNWLATTDANITYIGKPIDIKAFNTVSSSLTKRATDDVTVTYCSSRVYNVCGGECTVYTGGANCLNAPDTNCLSATANVGFCDRGGCGGSCNEYASCGTRMDNGFCYTPGTASILVPAS